MLDGEKVDRRRDHIDVDSRCAQSLYRLRQGATAKFGIGRHRVEIQQRADPPTGLLAARRRRGERAMENAEASEGRRHRRKFNSADNRHVYVAFGHVGEAAAGQPIMILAERARLLANVDDRARDARDNRSWPKHARRGGDGQARSRCVARRLV
ncbi:hypothetical protein [Methylosinus trichosporium]|uniref:hypothetical protein n=1 Tax=Methylosinus trichosporium TaxID=426 RepID=UPI001FCE7293|nr:hypothetical protein [Methylosinus trichosporium]